MKFVFVVGGSYKGFYINQLKNIKKIDLLVFHQDIFYDFEYAQEKLFNGPITKEIIELNNILKCPILIYGILKNNNIRQKCFILCVNGKVSIINSNKNVYLYIKGNPILINNKIYNYSKTNIEISMIDGKLNTHKFKKYNIKTHFICDKKGVTCIKKGKFYRKFRKCCYFSLSFKKKML